MEQSVAIAARAMSPPEFGTWLVHAGMHTTEELPDYYRVLGVERSASFGDIRSAYRAQSLRYHPDKLPSTATDNERTAATERFKALSEANKVLSDDTRRQEYDGQCRSGAPPARKMTMTEAYGVWTSVIITAFKEKDMGDADLIEFLVSVGLPGAMAALGGGHERSAKLCMTIFMTLNRGRVEGVLSRMSDDEQVLFRRAVLSLAHQL